MSDFTVIDIETTGSKPWVDKLVCVGVGSDVHRPDEGRARAREAMTTPGITLVAHTNYDLRWLLLDGAELGEDVAYHDTKVMAYLLDATQELALDALAARYLGFTPPKYIKMVGGRVMFHSETLGRVVPIEDAPWEDMEAYNQSDISTTAELYTCLRAKLMEQGMWERFIAEEAPFSKLLVEMEQTGLPINSRETKEMLDKLNVQRSALRTRIVDSVGVEDFNPGSTDQLGKWLYEELVTFPVKFEIPRLNGMSAERKLSAVESIAPPGVRVTKVGRDYAYGVKIVDGLGLKAPKIDKWKLDRNPDAKPTTSAKVLRVMHGNHPWVKEYLQWKELNTLANVFLTKWLEQEHEGRLHGRFDQAGTITGRLSGKEPNLQQVPNNEEWNVRALFQGPLVVGDYGGLEVRLSAHFSGDPVMLDIFRSGKDLYGVLAANAWGGPPDKTNPGRGLMKILMLSSQYGAQGDKLSDILAFAGMTGYGPRKSDALLRDLENTLPRLFEWRQEVIDEARALGYVTTLAGRKRHLPDINSAVWRQMAKSERQAVNSKVQGSAADVVRQAMLACRAAVNPEAAKIILQVHDEILWQREAGWKPEMFEELKDICEHGTGFELEVPLVFEAVVAESWAEKGGSAGQVKDGEYAELAEALDTVLEGA